MYLLMVKFHWSVILYKFLPLNQNKIKYIIIQKMMKISRENEKDLIAIDIGGSLIKICFTSNHRQTIIPHDKKLTIQLQFKSLFFYYFKIVQECWNFLQANFHQNDNYVNIILTGGGSYKYSEQLQKISKKINKNIILVQEFQSLVAGLSFFKIYDEYDQFMMSYISKQQGKQLYQNKKTNYNSIKDSPLLVVNIGSGVSILTVDKNEKGELKAERVGGTSLGGGFFLGLANLLVGQNNFHRLLEMGQKGNFKYTDITPQDFPQVSSSLSDASVLVSLGKLTNSNNPNDIVRSLFFMVTFNIAQIALSYSQIKNIKHVLFTGFYCRGNNYFLKCFAEAFNFFQRKTNSKFIYSMIHDGFLGALGSLQVELEKFGKM